MSVGKKRHGKAPANNIITYGKCDACGKIRFQSRADAKRRARQLFPGDHLTAYACGNWWHFGHPPASVVRGIGWKNERRLVNRAQQLRATVVATTVDCEACGATVTWAPGTEPDHECEVIGVDDDENARG